MIETTVIPKELAQGDIDDRLVQAALADPRQFGELYRRYVERIYRYLYSRVGDAAEAEDLTSQVFCEALQSLKRYRTGRSFAAWLFTIAARRKIDAYRSRPPALPLLEDQFVQDEDSPLEHAIYHETLGQLERLIANLEADEQELLRLHYAARLTYPEMAQVLGRSEAAIKMAMSRLIRQMRAQWEPDHE